MESLQILTETILQEAKETAQEKIKAAHKMVEDLYEKQRLLGIQRANGQGQLILSKAKDEAEIHRSAITAEAKIKSKWKKLSKKEEYINMTLDKAKSRMSTLTQSRKYISILEKLITEAGIMVGGRQLEVLLNEKDSKLKIRYELLAQKITEKTGSETKLTLSSERINVIGGVIVRTSDGKVLMDNSYDDIYARRSKELRTKIAKILFEEADAK